MSGPGVAVESGEIRYQTGPQRIKVDVADQFEEIGILLADDRFVPVLKKLARPMMLPVEIEGVAGKESAHEGSQTGLPGQEQQVHMVGHQRPGKAFDSGLDEEFGQLLQKPDAVGIIAEKVAAIDTADDDVLKQVGNIQAGGSWHAGRASSPQALVN